MYGSLAEFIFLKKDREKLNDLIKVIQLLSCRIISCASTHVF